MTSLGDPSGPRIPADLLSRIESERSTAAAALSALSDDLVQLRALLGSQPLAYRAPTDQPVLLRPHNPIPVPVRGGATAVPRPPVVPWYRREGMVSRVIAFVGSGVLLVGVALLLVFAAQNGYFGPVPRTVGGAVLAVALVVAAFWVRRQWPGNVGAIALAASGIAAAFIDVVAVSALYGWLPRTPALLLGEVIGIAGLWLARRWDSQPLAVIAVGGAMVLGPFVSPSPTATLLFLLVLTLVAPIFQSASPWPVLVVVRSLPTAIYAMLLAQEISLRDPDLALLVAAVTLLGAIGLWGAWLARPRTPDPGQSVVVACSSLLPILWVPQLVLAPRLDTTPAVAVLLACGVALLAAGFWRALAPSARGAAGATGTVAVALGVLKLTDGEHSLIVALGMGTATLLVGVLTRDGLTLIRGVVVAALGTLVWFPLTLAAVLGLIPIAYNLDAQSVIASVLVAASAVLVAYEARRRSLARRVGIAFVMLGTMIAAVSAALVGMGVLFGGAVSQTTDGFRGAHAVVTVGWMVAAGWLLLTGLSSSHGPLRRRFGLTLAALAVAKLFLFDLSMLPGLARIMAFLIGGLVLIVLGILYARAVERSRV